MRVAILGLGALLSCALPATAGAATLVNSGGVLTYTGAPGEIDDVYPRQEADGAPVVLDIRVVSVTAATGGSKLPQSPGRGTEYSCPDVTSFVYDAGDRPDSISAEQLRVPASILGGAGDDRLSGGTAGDVLDGGPGDDSIAVAAGDVVHGGSGIDV